MNKKSTAFAIVILLCFSQFSWAQDNGDGQASSPRAQKSPLTDRINVGGNFGLSFGNVDFVDISPRIGYRVNDRLTAGIGAIFRYRNDKRFSPNLETQDFGGSLFATYQIVAPFFLMAEYETLRYQVLTLPDFEKERLSFNSFLAGGGVSQPLGRRGSLNFIVLYNFSYTNSNPGPYNSPLVIRGGVGLNL